MNLWIRPERASRGPAPEHSRATIAAAAIGIADADGLAKVSMRRVAAALGTGAASLYRYVDTRDELVDLMADTIAGELDLGTPPSGDPIADLCSLGHRMRELYRRHPWMLDVLPGRTSLGPHTVDTIEWALGAMRDLDVSGRTKMETFALLNGCVGLFARSELGARSAGGSMEEWGAMQAQFLARTAADGRHPHLAAVLAEGPAEGADGDPFDRMLPEVLAGLLGQHRGHAG